MWKKYLVLVLAVLLVACSGSSSNNNKDKRSLGLERLKLEDVPIQSHRLAAQHATAWQEEKFAEVNFKDMVTPFYRPDIEGVAYYEFMLEPEGFVLISSGRHDYPVAQARDAGPAISEQLEFEAETQGKKVSKIYKMDSLAYYAENSDGELVGILGNPLFKLEEFEAWPSEETEPSEITATINDISDEEAPNEDNFEISETGPSQISKRDIGTGAWVYQNLKERYASYYAALINKLKTAASTSWEAEQLISQYGEGLVIGQNYPLPLLFSDAQASLSEGAEAFIELNQGASSLTLKAKAVPDNVNKAMVLNIQYANGLSENLNFGVVPFELSNTSLISTNLTTTSLTTTSLTTQNHTHWSSWKVYWAGSHNDQRIYKQFDISSNCPSGCGATAWAMLFGWADHQATRSNRYWQPRWGLYRENGGRSPARNAVAPTNMNFSIETITREIRGYIGSFCIAGSGPTLPWNMVNAWRYMIKRSGTTVKVGHNGLSGAHRSDHRNRAITSIRDRKTPAIIGTGWLSHYPLAYGYAERYRWVQSFWGNWYKEYQLEFLVNQGWGYYSKNKLGTFWEWIPASTWFVGEIFP